MPKFDPKYIEIARLKIFQAERSAKELFEKKLINFQKEHMKIQDKCIHPKKDIKYHADAAGGYDGFYECQLCEKQFNYYPHPIKK